MDFYDNINLDALQPLQDIFPDSWFDDVRQLYGESLSDEIISQSVEETCDFFHIEEPAIVSEGWTTGVYPNNDFTLQDDILIFNREQLLGMGITGKDGLDLVMTHEGTHRVLQGMEHLEFDAHQEELCCDYMAGVRAALNGIDVSQMENSLMYTPKSETHPAGVERVESIEAGVRFAQEYYAEYKMAPTFNECLDNFCETGNTEHSKQINLTENNISFKSQYTHLDSIYDPEIAYAEKKLEADIERIKTEGEYSWENPEHTLKHDIQRIKDLNLNKEQAIATQKINDSKQEYWDSITEYCKERMSKKIGQ